MLLIAGCALAAMLVQQATNSKATVVVAARSIERGSVIGPADLAAITLTGDTGALIHGDNARGLLGQTAVIDIAANTPLAATMVSAQTGLGADEALISVAVEPGRIPPELASGDAVRVVVVSPSSVGAPDQAVLLETTAIVWSVAGAESVGGNTIVTLRGPLTLATEVAAASTVQLVRIEGE